MGSRARGPQLWEAQLFIPHRAEPQEAGHIWTAEEQGRRYKGIDRFTLCELSARGTRNQGV